MYEPYKITKTSAQTYSWDYIPEYSQEYELEELDTLVKLRKRSADLIRNNEIAAGAARAFKYLINADAVKVVVKSKNKIQERQAQKIIDSLVKGVDINRSKTLGDFLNSLAYSSFRDGDVLINSAYDETIPGVCKSYLEVIEASRVQTPSSEKLKTDNYNGVKTDSKGRILGFWIKKQEKMDNGEDSSSSYNYRPRVKNDRVNLMLHRHSYDTRVGAIRQTPALTPVMLTLKLVGDYEEALVVGARVAACFAGFITTSNPNAVKDSATKDPSGNSTTDPSTGRALMKIQPGTLMPLKKNQKVEFASPNKPGDNVKDFLKEIQYRKISMALRIPYEMLFQDLSSINYSSWRGGSIDLIKLLNAERKRLGVVAEWYLKDICLKEANLKGLVRGDLEDISLTFRWSIPETLDPEKRARANKNRLANEEVSVQMLCDEQGLNYEDVQREIHEHEVLKIHQLAERLLLIKKYEDKLGIKFPENSSKEEGNRETALREGEEGNEKGKPNDEEKKERRKADGNW